jgi:hypothetical protein
VICDYKKYYKNYNKKDEKLVKFGQKKIAQSQLSTLCNFRELFFCPTDFLRGWKETKIWQIYSRLGH